MTEPTGSPELIAPAPAEPPAAIEPAAAIEPHDGTVGTVGDAEVVLTAPDPALLARLGDADASLLALIDRLAVLLSRSDLAELEVEAGATGLILRKPSAFVPLVSSVGGPAAGAGAAPAPSPAEATGPAERPSVKAPLTGIFYTSPAPGSAPFVTAGSEVAVGTVIGLIEAMKLFNEIKSDLAGRVVRVVAETGSLVKAKQPLIEVEPL
jgi:acetyl-CoA carboxylase biotin carboxyl carrier protein